MSGLLTILSGRRKLIKSGLVGQYDFGLQAGVVNSVPDLSGAGNHLVVGATSGSEASDPTFNGVYAAFDGGDYCHLNSYAGVTDDLSLYVVGWRNDDTQDTLVSLAQSDSAGSMVLYQVAASSEIRVFNGGDGAHVSTGDVWGTAAWHVGHLRTALSGVFSAGVDGTTLITRTGADYTIGHLAFGAVRDGDADLLIGRIAYALIYNRRLSDGEHVKTLQWLKWKLRPRGIVLP